MVPCIPIRVRQRSAGLLLLAALASMVPGVTRAAGRCAYVELSLFNMSEPKRDCFDLDKTCGKDETHGCFKGTLTFKEGWVDDAKRGRLRELSAPFGFIDPNGMHWDVPAGYQTDGASIPLFFQPIVGGPWTEGYIRAAVIHDFYIRRQTANADAVHKVFYLALLASGNSRTRAEPLYFAVANFGPQWKDTDVAAYDAAWRARKGMLDRINRWHQELWDAFQASEQRRKEQQAIDRAVLGLPLRQRARVFQLPEDGVARDSLDAFIAAAQRDHILHVDRDATLIKLLKQQVEAELQRPLGERSNVFVVQFTTFGVQTVSLAAHSDGELKTQLDLNDQFMAAQESGGAP